MSPVDREILGRLLRVLEQNVAHLRALGVHGSEELSATDVRRWALERGLQISIQGVLDIGAHLLAAHPAGPIDDYTSILDGLVRLGVVGNELGVRMRPMAGLRNLLVHQYADVDPAKLVDFAANRLGDLDEFLAAVVEWLQKN